MSQHLTQTSETGRTPEASDLYHETQLHIWEDDGGATPPPDEGQTFSSLNCKESNAAPIATSAYAAVEQHQLQQNDWRYGQVMSVFLDWKAIFDNEFQLNLPEVVFCIGFTRCRCAGYFRPGHNWYGMRREILIKEGYLLECVSQGDTLYVLTVVLHELLHAWQEEHGLPGKGNYHNVEFCRKASECGLDVDSRGYTDILPNGPLHDLVAKYGLPELEIPDVEKFQPLPTEQMKWVCDCHPQYAVRVAIDNFQADCRRCGGVFRRCEDDRIPETKINATNE